MDIESLVQEFLAIRGGFSDKKSRSEWMPSDETIAVLIGLQKVAESIDQLRIEMSILSEERE